MNFGPINVIRRKVVWSMKCHSPNGKICPVKMRTNTPAGCSLSLWVTLIVTLAAQRKTAEWDDNDCREKNKNKTKPKVTVDRCPSNPDAAPLEETREVYNTSFQKTLYGLYGSISSCSLVSGETRVKIKQILCPLSSVCFMRSENLMWTNGKKQAQTLRFYRQTENEIKTSQPAGFRNLQQYAEVFYLAWIPGKENCGWSPDIYRTSVQ